MPLADPVAELQCWNKATRWEPHDMFFCEPMPLEATADNVQLSVFAAKASNSTLSVRPFMRTLLRLTDYLVDNGLVRVHTAASCPVSSSG